MTVEILEDRTLLNNAPIAYDYTFNVQHDQPIVNLDIRPYATYDADNDPLQINFGAFTGPGIFTPHVDNTFSFLPQPDWAGNVSFVFTASDPSVATSEQMTITIQVMNIAPVANDYEFNVQHDQQLLNLDLRPYATYDADGDELEISVASFSGPGDLDQNEDGTLTFTPQSDWAGNVTFDFRATDQIHTTEWETITIHVMNNAPVANAYTFNVQHDQQMLNLDIRPYATYDADGDELDITITGPWGPTSPGPGNLEKNPDGTFNYTPPAGVAGSFTFTFTATD